MFHDMSIKSSLNHHFLIYFHGMSTNPFIVLPCSSHPRRSDLSDLRAETLDHDVPGLVANYCHAALNSLEEAIAHLAPSRRSVGDDKLVNIQKTDGKITMFITIYINLISFLKCMIYLYIFKTTIIRMMMRTMVSHIHLVKCMIYSSGLNKRNP